MKKLLNTSLIVISFVIGTAFRSVEPTPEVGQKMPYFTLSNVSHFKTGKVTSDDFKGKWLFLDFWSTRCLTCVQSFRKVNAIYTQFKDQLNWVMVGINDTKYNSNIESFYEKFRRKQNLQMPAAFDSVLQRKWDIYGLPHIIIVDPSGVVRFITTGADITTEKVSELLNGEIVQIKSKNISQTVNDSIQSNSEKLYSPTDKNLLIQSTLTKWNGERQYAYFAIDSYVANKSNLKEGFKISMMPLYMLYKYAYIGCGIWDFKDTVLFGKTYPNPILQIRDSSLFNYDFRSSPEKGMFNYSLILPSAEVTKERIMTLMQEDLKRIFKFDVFFENREMPVWKLVAKPGAIENLKTKGGERYITPGNSAAGYIMRNVSHIYLLGGISFVLDDIIDDPFIDETGITGNIDFSIEADMTSIDDVKRELQKQGLDLIKGTKNMRVLVIRDPKDILN